MNVVDEIIMAPIGTGEGRLISNKVDDGAEKGGRVRCLTYVKVRSYGATVVVLGILTYSGRVAGKELRTIQKRFARNPNVDRRSDR